FRNDGRFRRRLKLASPKGHLRDRILLPRPARALSPANFEFLQPNPALRERRRTARRLDRMRASDAGWGKLDRLPGPGSELANAQEHLLAALNACMMVGYVAQCAVRGITLESLEIDTDGEIDSAKIYSPSPIR